MRDMKVLHDSGPAMVAIAESLGINHLPLQKMVLVLEVGTAPQLYIKGLTPEAVLPTICKVVSDVQVSDQCEVVVEEV